MKVYIAGTINGLNPEEVLERFWKIEKVLKYKGFEVLNPMRGKIISDTKTGFLPYESNEIVHRDLWDIKNSDIVLAVFPEVGIGTAMEIMYARERDIPVILVSDNSMVVNHYWVKSLCSKIVSNIAEGIQYLEDWYAN